MDKKQHDKIAAFDTLYTTNHIQMLKIIIPVVNKEFRHKLAVYIKYMEFQYTFSLAASSPHSFNICTESENSSFDFCSLCDELYPFCTEKEQGILNNLKNVQNMFKQYKEMESMMSMMKEIFPDSDDFGNTGGDHSGNMFSPDMLMQLLSPEQQELFSMFSNKED